MKGNCIPKGRPIPGQRGWYRETHPRYQDPCTNGKAAQLLFQIDSKFSDHSLKSGLLATGEKGHQKVYGYFTNGSTLGDRAQKYKIVFVTSFLSQLKNVKRHIQIPPFMADFSVFPHISSIPPHLWQAELELLELMMVTTSAAVELLELLQTRKRRRSHCRCPQGAGGLKVILTGTTKNGHEMMGKLWKTYSSYDLWLLPSGYD